MYDRRRCNLDYSTKFQQFRSCVKYYTLCTWRTLRAESASWLVCACHFLQYEGRERLRTYITKSNHDVGKNSLLEGYTR